MIYPRYLLTRARTLLTRVKLPGWAVILIGILWGIPEWFEKAKFWIEVVQGMGGRMGMIAAIVGNPYFPLGLVAVGVAYLVLVGEPSKGVQRHHWWPYVGWGLFALCVTTIIAIAGYGWIEIYIRQQIVDRQATALHDAANPNAPPRTSDPQFDYHRHLSPDQFRALNEVATRLKPFASGIHIAIAPNDTEAWVYRREIGDALSRAGIRPIEFDEPPEGPTDVGVMIAVRDKTRLPPAAEKLREILEIVGVPSRYVEKYMSDEKQFFLYIGPKPI